MVLEQLSTVEPGWTVKGSDGSSLGDVVAVREDHIVVRAGTISKHELYVPVSAVESVGEESVVLNVAAGDADEAGWRYPPQRPYTRPQDLPPTESKVDQTTMTGATFGAGGGVSSAGPPEPGFGDAVEDRFGGSGRAGLSGLSGRSDDNLEPVDESSADAGGLTGSSDDDDTSDDTSEGTSEGTSEDTSEDTSEGTSGDDGRQGSGAVAGGPPAR